MILFFKEGVKVGFGLEPPFANPGFGKVLADMVEAIKLLIAAALKSPTLLPGE